MECIPFIGDMTLAIPVESNDGAGPFQPLMEDSETSFDVLSGNGRSYERRAAGCRFYLRPFGAIPQ